MNIRVECYGVVARLSGAHIHELCLRDNVATVGIALDALAQCYPELTRALPRCACAVNEDIVVRTHRLIDGDTLAILPPVAGG